MTSGPRRSGNHQKSLTSACGKRTTTSDAKHSGSTSKSTFAKVAPSCNLFGPTKPTILEDTLWNLTGTRRLDAQGDIGEYDRPFIAECWTPEYIAHHLARRTFGFNMRVATWLQ
jgi:hypothetical protein